MGKALGFVRLIYLTFQTARVGSAGRNPSRGDLGTGGHGEGLVAEVADAGGDEGDAELVGGGDDFVVAD